mgnify:FL=1|jgi:hypothetical protein
MRPVSTFFDIQLSNSRAIEENSKYIDIAYKLTIIIEKYYKYYRNNQFAYMSRM